VKTTKQELACASYNLHTNKRYEYAEIEEEASYSVCVRIKMECDDLSPYFFSYLHSTTHTQDIRRRRKKKMKNAPGSSV
jgi:hypothetical protein